MLRHRVWKWHGSDAVGASWLPLKYKDVTANPRRDEVDNEQMSGFKTCMLDAHDLVDGSILFWWEIQSISRNSSNENVRRGRPRYRKDQQAERRRRLSHLRGGTPINWHACQLDAATPKCSE
jgi:hypothetical protein